MLDDAIFSNLLILYPFSVHANLIFLGLTKFTTENWEPDVALPLVYGEFTANELIEEFGDSNAITADESKLITLIYEGEVFSKTAQELLPPPMVGF